MHPEFTKNILSLYEENGQKWLHNMPHRINQIAQIWHLTELKPVKKLSYNYVLSGIQYGKPVILKIAFRIDAMRREIEALQHFNGSGCVTILDASNKHGAILLEQVIPGDELLPLSKTHPNEALQISCNIVRKLHSTAKTNHYKSITHISEWTKILDESWPQLQQQRLKTARKLRDELLASMKDSVILHGDLHYENILKHNNQWVAIDPKGVIGEPAIDLWCLVRDNQLVKNAATMVQIDSKRLYEWGYVMSILSCCWRIEDNLPFTPFLKYVETFEPGI